jgi:hypothetical protein
MSRELGLALTTLIALGLAGSLFLQVWAFPSLVTGIAGAFPEVEWLVVPGVVWGALAIGCWQAIAVITLRIVALARGDRFDASAYGLVWAIVGCLMVFLALVAAVLIALTMWGYTSPAMLALSASGILAGAVGVPLLWFLLTRPAVTQGPGAS